MYFFIFRSRKNIKPTHKRKITRKANKTYLTYVYREKIIQYRLSCRLILKSLAPNPDWFHGSGPRCIGSKPCPKANVKYYFRSKTCSNKFSHCTAKHSVQINRRTSRSISFWKQGHRSWFSVPDWWRRFGHPRSTLHTSTIPIIVVILQS